MQKTITIRHTVTQAMVDGKYKMIYKDRPKSKKSLRTLPLVGPYEAILSKLWKLLGHSDISTTLNIYTHLDYRSKVSSANAIIGILPGENEKELPLAAN